MLMAWLRSSLMSSAQISWYCSSQRPVIQEHRFPGESPSISRSRSLEFWRWRERKGNCITIPGEGGSLCYSPRPSAHWMVSSKLRVSLNHPVCQLICHSPLEILAYLQVTLHIIVLSSKIHHHHFHHCSTPDLYYRSAREFKLVLVADEWHLTCWCRWGWIVSGL